MKKRLIAVCLMAFMVANTVIGCGSSTTTEEATTEATTEAATEAATDTAASDEEVTVTVFCAYAGEDPHGQYVYQYAEDFMAENENITIEITYVSSSDIYTKLSAMATTPDDIPTLFYVNTSSAATLSGIGITQDINEVADQALIDTLANGVYESTELNGAMTFFPVVVQPTAMLYRVDRFEELGLEIPETWEEFYEVCEALTRDTDGDGVTDEWAFSMVGENGSSGQGRYLSYLWSNGYDVVYEEDGVWKTDITADDTEFLEVFSLWTDLNEDGLVPVGITEVDYSTAANYFAMGYTSLFMTGSNALGVAYTSNPDLEGLVGSFTLPGSAAGTQLGTEGYGMSAYATDAEKEAAMAFLEYFLTNDEDMNFWNASGKIPATTEGQEVDYIQESDYAGYIQQIEDGCLDTCTFEGLSGLKSVLGDAYSAVFSGEKDNQAAIEELVSDIDELLADYN